MSPSSLATKNASAEPRPASSPRAHSLLSGKIIPVSLFLIFALQCAWFIATQSLTFDEPVHIAAGLDAWRHQRFEVSNDHPPLAHLLCSLPLLNPKWQVEVQPLPDGFRIPRISPDPVALAWRARAMDVLLGLLLALLVWREAATHFSIAAANCALALFAFTPSLIAHFSLATTDGAAALLIFATAIQVRRWRLNPCWRATALTGVVLGLVLLAKLSTLPMFAVAVALLLFSSREHISVRPWRWNWPRSLTAVLIGLFVFWAGYFFHVSRLTIRDGVLTVSHPHWETQLVKPTRSRLNFSMPVPAGEYVAGFRDLVFRNAHGQRAFFLGQLSLKGGWKSYYPVALLLKWPLLLWIAALAGIAVCFSRRMQLQRGFWIMFLFPTVYFAIAISSRFNIGERHILPLYPFALLLVAAAADWLTQRRWGVAFACVLLVLNAADCLRYAPAYLSYMNVFVTPATSYRLLSDSNLDWGQGLLAVRKYQEQHPTEQLSLAYFGSVDPGVYGIQATPLAEDDRPSGTVIVSATELTGQYLRDPDSYRWLLQYKPKQILDHCMYVFQPNR